LAAWTRPCGGGSGGGGGGAVVIHFSYLYLAAALNPAFHL
jgi:hypothetical protein